MNKKVMDRDLRVNYAYNRIFTLRPNETQLGVI